MQKNRKIKAYQKDLIENVETVIFDGYGSVEHSSHLSIKYDESTDCAVHIKVDQENGFLSRTGEADTNIIFNVNEMSSATIKTAVGEIFMDIITEEITSKTDNLVIAYKISQQGNIVSDFIMKVEWENE